MPFKVRLPVALERPLVLPRDGAVAEVAVPCHRDAHSFEVASMVPGHVAPLKLAGAIRLAGGGMPETDRNISIDKGWCTERGETTPTEEVTRLEVRVKRLVYLVWPLRWFQEHRGRFEDELKIAVARGEGWLPATIDDLAKDLVAFSSCVAVTMLWTFYEEYNRSVNRGPRGEGHDDTEQIVKNFPQYSVQCHPNHERVHVLEAVRDIRNRFIHGVFAPYESLRCDQPPEEVVLVQEEVIETEAGHKVFSLAGRTPDEQKEIDQALLQTRRSRSPDLPVATGMTFGEALEVLLLDCIRAYDVTVERRRKAH